MNYYTARLVALYFIVCVLTVNVPTKVLGNTRKLNIIRLGLEAGSGLVPIYYLFIVVTIIAT